MKIIFAATSDYQNIYFKVQVPLGILSLATVIKKDGSHEAGVIDFNSLYNEKIFIRSESLEENISKDADHILRHKPDVISFYTMCNNFHVALLMAMEVKRRNPGIKVLFGGPQATLVAEKTLEKYLCVDGIGIGEGENTILGILEGLSKDDLARAKGIAYRKNGKIVVQPNDMLIENLDELPIIDLSLYPYKIENNISLDIGRGCPFSCIFCSTKVFWKRRFRIKSAERIFEEIKYYHGTYGIHKFQFEHDLFVANRKLVFELCRKIKESKLNISWGCSARVDTVDEELIGEMTSAGCKSIFFGVESGSERIQKYIQKNLELNRVRQLPELLDKYKVQGTLSFIYGFPEETKEDIEATLKLIHYIFSNHDYLIQQKLLTIQLHKIMYLPETELTKVHAKELKHSKNYSMEVFVSLNEWKHPVLNQIIQDVELFPNLCYIPSPLADSLQELDKYYQLFWVQSISLFEVTYKGILEEMGGSYLNVFYEFSKYLKANDKDYYKLFFTESATNSNRVISIYKRFLEGYNFIHMDKQALLSIYEFEKDIYELLYRKRMYKTDIDVVQEYNYDVVLMRKRKAISLEKTHTKVRFFVEKEKYVIQKIELTEKATRIPLLI